MSKKLTEYKADLLADLGDPEYAALYVSSALRESSEDFLLALRDVAEARKMCKVAEEAQLNRVSLYRMLSGTGNPRLSSLTNVLKTLGLRLEAVADCQDEEGVELTIEPRSGLDQTKISNGIAAELGLTKTNVRNIQESTMWQQRGDAASAQSTIRQEPEERARKPIAAAESDSSEGMRACR